MTSIHRRCCPGLLTGVQCKISMRTATSQQKPAHTIFISLRERKREKKEERRHVLSEASQYYSNTAHTVQTGCHGYTVTALEEE